MTQPSEPTEPSAVATPVVDPTVAYSSVAPPPVPAVVVAPAVAYVPPSTGPSLLVRALWFIFAGWWLSAFAIGLAYFFCLIIIGLPLGFMIFNRLPLILTLRERSASQAPGGTVEQLPLWIRAIWFIFVGWWVGAIYMLVAWVLCVILITLPIGLWMFNRVGAVMTLLRY